MKLREVKITLSHKYNFFQNNELEKIISNIQFHKLETHISESHKLAIIKMENDFYMLISDKSIQLRMQSLDVVEQYISILDVLDENINKHLMVEMITFTGVLNTNFKVETFNQAFKDELPSRFKVKMLGVDIQSENFEYRLSLNKKKDFIRVTVNTILKNDINQIVQDCNDAYNEFNDELEILLPLL